MGGCLGAMVQMSPDRYVGRLEPCPLGSYARGQGRQQTIQFRVPMNPTVISLFSGAGGLDFGFEAAGFDIRACVEIDSDACQTLRSNRPWNILEADVLSLEASTILSEAGLERREADVLVAGPPCQPFSKSGFWARGDTLGLNDPRAATLSALMRIWEETLPQAVVLENVPGFAYRGRSEALNFVTDYIDEINAREGTSYAPYWAVLNAADFGVPQMRQRFVLVADRDGQSFRFPQKTHQSGSSQADGGCERNIEPHRTAWDAIGDLDGSDSTALALTGRWSGLLPSIPEGNNYLFHTDRGGGLSLFGWRRRYWSFLLKLAKTLPSWTIQAEPGPATGPFHWSNRRLSIRELCRLQTFADDVEIHGDDRIARRQIGNAVPPLLAEVIAREIRAQLLCVDALLGTPRLLPRVRPSPPPPEPVSSVPDEYHMLLNSDDSHPGTGRGRAALARLGR